MDQHKTSKPSENEDKVEPPESSESPAPSEAPKVSSKKNWLPEKKWLILAATAVVLIGGAASWYFFIHKKSPKPAQNTANSSNNSQSSTNTQSLPSTVVFLRELEPSTNNPTIKKLDLKTAIVTDYKKLPDGIDIIAEDTITDVPHIYWTVGGTDKPLDIYYMDGEKDPQKIASLDKKYSIFYGAILPDHSGVTIIEHTYEVSDVDKIVTVKNDGTVKTLFSADSSFKWPDGTTLPLIPSFWSDDATSLFLTSLHCLDCDGGSEGTMHKFEAATNKLTTVLPSTLNNGSSYRLNFSKIVGSYCSTCWSLGIPGSYEDSIATKQQIVVYDFMSGMKSTLYEDSGPAVPYTADVIGNNEDGSTLYVGYVKPIKSTKLYETTTNHEITATEFFQVRKYNVSDGTYSILALPDTGQYSDISLMADKAGYLLYRVGRIYQPADTTVATTNYYIFADGAAKKLDLSSTDFIGRL